MPGPVAVNVPRGVEIASRTLHYLNRSQLAHVEEVTCGAAPVVLQESPFPVDSSGIPSSHGAAGILCVVTHLSETSTHGEDRYASRDEH